MNRPETKYTKVGESLVAYQVVGEGPIDLVLVSGLASNIETMWEYPPLEHMLERMASYSRLILFDPRGSGVSDPAEIGEASTWEQWTEDLRAVLAAAGSKRTAILAQHDGGFRAILYAAIYPDRTAALILWNSYARSVQADDYPLGTPREATEAMFEMMGKVWGTLDEANLVVPGAVSSDPEYAEWFAKYRRMTMSPGRAVKMMRYVSEIDVRSVLPSVRVPTLVLHRRESPFIPLEQGRYIAEHIPHARFIEIPGVDLAMHTANTEAIHGHIEEFLGVASQPHDMERALATLLFTDIVGSTERAAAVGDRRWKNTLEAHDRIARSQIERFHGRLVNRMGDGMLATFEGPGRAIRCAQAIARALEPADIKIRAGLHTGEIELRDDGDVGGIAVHIAARVMHEAASGEVICSRTVKDLVAGSEFSFEDRGVHALKGVPDQWQLFAVRS